jgi:hypothetical protein
VNPVKPRALNRHVKRWMKMTQQEIFAEMRAIPRYGVLCERDLIATLCETFVWQSWHPPTWNVS